MNKSNNFEHVLWNDMQLRPPEGVEPPAVEAPAPFPKQFAPWRDGCYLYEPLDGLISRPAPGQKLQFALEVPRALKVAIVIPGEEWTQLQQLSSTEAAADPLRATAWLGAVALDKVFDQKVGKLSVVANFDAEKPAFRTLLEYTLAI